MNMVRVCILTSCHDSMDNRVYYKEVVSLSKRFDVYYIAPANKAVPSQNIHPITIKKYNSVVKRVAHFNRIYKILKKEKFDVIHFQDVELLPLMLKAKKHLRCKIIYDVHEDYRDQMLYKFYLPKILRKVLSKYVIRLEHKADEAFDAIVTADNFIFNYFSNPRRIVIFNYPKMANFNQLAMESNVEKRNTFDMIFPGTMSADTAYFIVDGVARIKRTYSAIKCAIISTFHFKNGKRGLEDYIKSNGLSEENLVLIDFVPTNQVQNYLSKTKIGIVPLVPTPKLMKNIPTKIFEFMFCYLPVIASDLPPARQYLGQHNCGLLFIPNSVDDFASKVIELLNNPKLCNEMGRIGHECVNHFYSWENEEAKLFSLYDSIL